MSYKKPILIELYAQFQMEPGSFPAARFFDVVPRLRERGFESVEFSGGLGGIVSGIVGIPTEMIDLVPRIRCWSADRSQLVQLASDLVVINLVISPEGQYPGWTPFTDLARWLLGVVVASVRPAPGFISVSLTAIDQFRVPRERFQRVDEYLQCDGTMLPSWLANVAAAFDVSIGKGLIATDGFNRQLQARGRFTNGEYEIRFQTVFHDRSKASGSVLRLLDGLHDEANEAFESLITDRVREEVMGGKIADAVNA